MMSKESVKIIVNNGKLSNTNPANQSILKILIQTIILILFSANTLHALTPVIIDENTESVSLGKYMEILEDPTDELTIDDVTKPEMQGRWFQSKWDVPNFGFTDKTYWFRYKLLRQKSIISNFYFQLKWAHVNEIKTFETASNQIVRNYKTGDFLLFSERPVKNRNFLFPLSSNLEESIIYIKIRSNDSLQLPFLLLRDDVFYQKDNNDILFHGISFGFLIVLLIYNLFIYFSIRDINFLFYNIFVFTQIIFQISFFGFGYQYIWGTNPYFQRLAVAVSSIFALMSTIVFNCSFLRINKLSSFLYSVLKIIFLLLVSGLVLTFFNYIKFSFIILNFSGCIAAILLILASVKALRLGRPGVRFFITAWMLMISATILFMLKNSGFFYFYSVIIFF